MVASSLEKGIHKIFERSVVILEHGLLLLLQSIDRKFFEFDVPLENVIDDCICQGD